jgi:MSHA biogenesis protein MshP
MNPTTLILSLRSRLLKPTIDMTLRQRGFTIVSAIFLLVVLSVLGAAIVTISTSQSLTAAQDYQGSQAYHAARAGVEWGVYMVMDPSHTTLVPTTDPKWPNMPDCPVGSAPTPISGFTINLTCTRYPTGAVTAAGPPVYQEGGGPVKSISVYQLTSTASKGTPGSIDYVERQIRVTVSKCRTTETDPIIAPNHSCS